MPFWRILGRFFSAGDDIAYTQKSLQKLFCAQGQHAHYLSFIT